MPGLKQRIEKLKWTESPNLTTWAEEAHFLMDQVLTELDKTIAKLETSDTLTSIGFEWLRKDHALKALDSKKRNEAEI